MLFNDDHNLIRKIANNDMQGLETLYRKYYADVYRLAYMVTKQTATSEDIAQTVFVKITKCAHQYRAEGSVKGWIIQITRSIALNVIKHNSFSQSIDVDDLINIPSQENDFEDVEFLSALEGLSPAMREITLLHVVYKLKHHEIAKILSKSHNAVRQQYKRAIDILKKNYSEDNGIVLKGGSPVQ
jgi:RNA polymerase sigma-70 factor (ECF subfamily)